MGLWANLPRARAIRILREVNYGPGTRLSPDDLYSLVLTATDDREAADNVRVAHEQAIADSQTPGLG